MRAEIQPRAPAQPMAHAQQGQQPRPGAAAPAGVEGREGWSLGDLLARASREEETQASAQRAAPPAHSAFRLDAAVIARALDSVTAQTLWARLRAGQRGVMVRSMYTNDGRAAFDEITRQYRVDPGLKQTVDRYVADFERMQADLDHRDPSGRATEAQIMSDSGRVYLFLAHAAGRL